MNDIEATKDKARQLLGSRINSITELVKTRQRVTELETQLAAAKKDDKKAYVRATKDGWSKEELKKLGLDEHASTRRRQPAREQVKLPAEAGPGPSRPGQDEPTNALIQEGSR